LYLKNLQNLVDFNKMLDMLFQVPDIPINPFMILTIATFIGMFLFELIMLKVGLFLSKAEIRKDILWVLGSSVIQIGLLFIILSPVLLNIIAGAYNNSPPPIFLIVSLVIMYVIVDVNVINVIHHIGIAKSFGVFIIFTVPLFFVVGFIVPILFNLLLV